MLISLIGMGLSCFGISIFKIIGDSVGAILRILSYYQRKYIILYLFFKNPSESNIYDYMIVACVIIMICSFGAGLGVIPNLIAVELFDSSARNKANSVACMVNWLSNLCVTLSFQFINVIF